MKILFLNTFYSPDTLGGAEVVLQTLVEGAAAKGHEAIVLATTDQRGLHKDEVNGIRIWRAGIQNVFWPVLRVGRPFLKKAFWHLVDSYNPAMERALKDVLEIERPTVASVHNLAGWSVATWAAFHAVGIPFVQVLHDHYLLCPRCTMFRNGENCTEQCVSCRALRFFHEEMSRKASGVVGVSRYILDRHIQGGLFRGVPHQSVIFNACRSSDLYLDEYSWKEGRAKNEGIRFGFIGSLHHGKGVEDLIRAFVLRSPVLSELWIAGSGTKEYEERLRKLSSGASVRFLGRMRPVDFYPNIDVVVVPSRWNESLPTVVIEAMAFGKAVIASSVGGIPELVKHAETGLLVKPGDPEDLSFAMREMASQPDMRRSFEISAKKGAAFFLDHEGFVENHLQVYGSVCAYSDV